MTDVKKCKEQVRDEGRWPNYHQCRYNAKKDGYCGIHHPDAAKRRLEKYEARYDEKWDRAAFDRRAGDRCRELGIQPEEIKA